MAVMVLVVSLLTIRQTNSVALSARAMNFALPPGSTVSPVGCFVILGGLPSSTGSILVEGLLVDSGTNSSVPFVIFSLIMLTSSPPSVSIQIPHSKSPVLVVLPER